MEKNLEIRTKQLILFDDNMVLEIRTNDIYQLSEIEHKIVDIALSDNTDRKCELDNGIIVEQIHYSNDRTYCSCRVIF